MCYVMKNIRFYQVLFLALICLPCPLIIRFKHRLFLTIFAIWLQMTLVITHSNFTAPDWPFDTECLFSNAEGRHI